MVPDPPADSPRRTSGPIIDVEAHPILPSPVEPPPAEPSAIVETKDAAHSAPPPPAAIPRRLGCFAWGCLTVISVALILGLLAWKLLDSGVDLAKYGFGSVAEATKNLQQQHISNVFHESVTKISSVSDTLEVATLETDVTSSRSDVRTLFGNAISLGETVSEIKVPVVYRYHIKLSDPWEIQIDGARCVVKAPQLRPSLPPAVRTDKMEKRSDAGWLRFNASALLSQTEKGLTPFLEKRAASKTTIDLVREQARDATEDFVKKWLLKDKPWGSGGIESIEVIFPDDPAPAGTPEAAPPQ